MTSPSRSTRQLEPSRSRPISCQPSFCTQAAHSVSLSPSVGRAVTLSICSGHEPVHGAFQQSVALSGTPQAMDADVAVKLSGARQIRVSA